MFVVDAAILLPHPPRAVARVVERLHVLPRWCGGLRRVRFPAPDLAAGVGCVFTYRVADLRLTLLARTLERAPDAPATLVEHTATGDGLTLTWTLAVEPEAGGAGGADRAGGVDGVATRLRARTSVAVDPDHPTSASRLALCRVVARRAPTDLERLRALLDRYEAGRAPAPSASPAAPRPGDLAHRPFGW